MNFITKTDWREEIKSVDNLLFWSICLLFFVLPLGPAPTEIAGGIMLGLWLVSGQWVKQWKIPGKQDWLLPVLILILLPLVGLFWTNDIQTGLKFAKKSYYWLFAFAVAGAILRNKTPKIFIDAFLSGLSLNVFVALLQYMHWFPMHRETNDLFPTGFMGHIDFPLFLVFGLLLLSFYYSHLTVRKQKLGILLLMALYFMSLSVNIGRSGYLAFILVCPWIFYNLLSRRHIAIIALASVVFIALLFSSKVFQDRVELAINDIKTYYQGNPSTSIGQRLYIWEGSIRMFAQNPILGVGTGGFHNALSKYKNDPGLPDLDHPHNSFLYIATEFGLAGLSGFIWFLWVFMRKGWKNRNTYVGFAILAYLAVFLIGSLTDTEIRSHPALIMLILLTGIQIDILSPSPSLVQKEDNGGGL